MLTEVDKTYKTTVSILNTSQDIYEYYTTPIPHRILMSLRHGQSTGVI